MRFFQWQRYIGSTERQQPTCETSAPHNSLSHTLSTQTGLSSLLLGITLKGSTLQQKHLQNFGIFQNKKYPGNPYCNGSNPRTMSTSTVNNNNNNTVNKVFKFYIVSHIHIKKENTITWTKSCMKPAGKEFPKPITIWSIFLKNIFYNLLSSKVLQIIVIKVFHWYFLYSPKFPTHLLLCRFLCAQIERIQK